MPVLQLAAVTAAQPASLMRRVLLALLAVGVPGLRDVHHGLGYPAPNVCQQIGTK